MPERLLQLDDLLNIRSPEKIATLFQKLGYDAAAQPLNIEDLHLPARSTDAIYDSYLIADQGNGGLQILLFQLHPDEWTSVNAVSSRMRAIANVICQRATEFLLLATKDFNQLMLVNPRKNYDAQLNLKTSIRKLLIDSTNPTNYDRDRLEAIAVRAKSPQELYKTHCEAFDVDKLTKSFYRSYEQIFKNVQQAVKLHNDDLYFADADRLHQFSQRLLGRIMFLYFLQKKGFLAGDYRFLTTRYRSLKTEPDETDYYAQVLEPLFFETLNQNRDGLVHRWGEGQIPYLNGGLFDRDYGEGIKDAAGRETPVTITLPNSLFDPGEPEAIEIAKLRMWLSLVVDIPDIEDVEPLPNLDYKLMCGDSLISTIHGERLIPDPTKEQQLMLAVTPIQTAIQPLLELQRRYFDAQTEERHELRSQILAAEANVFKTAVNDRRQFWEGKQQDLERKIKAFKGKVSKTQEKERTEIGSKLMELDRFASDVESGERSLNFFQYHLHFNDVFKDKGGFDVVIGNPPYVRQEAIKELKPALQKEYDCYTGVADLFVYFYEQGFNLLKSGGHLSYITSNKYFRAGYGEKLRKFLGEKSKVEVLIDFGDSPVFEAIAYPSIILVSKSKPDNHQARVLNWEAGKTVEEFNSVYKSHSFYLPQKELGADGWRLESPAVLRLLDKLRSAGTPLGEYVNEGIYYGIKSGLNEAFEIDEETKKTLISNDYSSKDIIRPWLRGRNIKRWNINYPNTYLIYTYHKIEINHYPAILDYLSQYKDQLQKRATINSHAWYEIQQPQYIYARSFDKPKIVFPDIALESSFALDVKNTYPDTTSFILPTDDKFLLGVINSNIALHFYQKISSQVRGGYLRYKTQYVKQIPIPTAPEADRQAIEAVVQKCLDAKGQGVEEWEAEIDDRVAHLYGLTAEEMKIIRGE